MATHHHIHGNQQAATLPAPSKQSSHKPSRWLQVATCVCGALAGASIIEAIATLASHAGTPVTPSRLIAEPLVIIGALCGGLLAAVLVGNNGGRFSPHTTTDGNEVLIVEVTPGDPLVWNPTPLMLPTMPADTTSPISRLSAAHSSLGARRIHRAIRRHGHHYHTVRRSYPRPAALG